MNAPLDKQPDRHASTAPHFPIYMDYSATTPIDPRVADKMIPYLREQFGNPASRSHMYGWTAEEAVEEARGHVAALVNADPREIIWTSGATEGNNLALKGAAQFYKTKGKHIITVKTEHKAVLDTVRELERQGFEATYLRAAGQRPDHDRAAGSGDPPGHHPGVGDAGQQRDRRDPADRRDRRTVPHEGHHLPLRRRAGDRQGAYRPAKKPRST